MACRDPGGAKCAGTQTASAAGVMALSRVFFRTSCAGDQKASLASLSSYLCQFRHLEGSLAWGPSLLFRHQEHRGAPLVGVLLCRMAHQSLKGALVGSYSIVQCVRRLMGQPLYCSAADAGVWRERGLVMAPPPTRDSAVLPCLHGCLAFLHWHFPPQSPPSHPLYLSL